eukprot:scpid104534/ scgid30502/ 
MATAVVYKKVGSVSVKEARQALTDLFEDNPYLERSLGIHALSVKAYPQKDNRVLRVFVVTETDVKLDQETALVEDFPENSFDGKALAIVLHSTSPRFGLASASVWRKRGSPHLRRLFKTFNVFSFKTRHNITSPATRYQLREAAKFAGLYRRRWRR